MTKKIGLVFILLIISGSLRASEIYNKEGTTFSFDGRVNIANNMFSNDGNITKSYMDNRSSRLTFSGTREISEGVKAFGEVEWGYNPVQSAVNPVVLENRLGNLGIDIKGNKITYGRQWSVYNDVTTFTDIYEVAGGDATSSYYKSDAHGVGRSNSVQYSTSVSIVDLAFQYQGSDKNPVVNADGTIDERDWSSGASMIIHPMEGLKIGVASQFVQLKYSDQQPVYTVYGLRYNNKYIKFSVVGSTLNEVYGVNSSSQAVETYLAFKITEKGSKIYIGNNFLITDDSQNEKLQNMKGKYKNVNYAVIGGTYNILDGTKFYVYGEYKYDLRQSDDIIALNAVSPEIYQENINCHEQKLTVGGRYSF